MDVRAAVRSSSLRNENHVLMMSISSPTLSLSLCELTWERKDKDGELDADPEMELEKLEYEDIVMGEWM